VLSWCKLTINFICFVAVSLCFSLLLDHYHIQIVGALVWTMDPIKPPTSLGAVEPMPYPTVSYRLQKSRRLRVMACSHLRLWCLLSTWVRIRIPQPTIFVKLHNLCWILKQSCRPVRLMYDRLQSVLVIKFDSHHPIWYM